MEGTDLSPQAIQRARREALEAGASARFAVADFRALDTQVPGTFDLVISCDNALPHLLTGEDLRLGVRNMRSKLTPGGLLLASIRDYDRLLQEKPPATMPAVYDGPEGKTSHLPSMGVGEPSGPTYRVHFFILRVREGQWQTFHQTMVYRALPRDELTDALREEGLSDIRWHMPDETDYFQPIVTALRIG